MTRTDIRRRSRAPPSIATARLASADDFADRFDADPAPRVIALHRGRVLLAERVDGSAPTIEYLRPSDLPASGLRCYLGRTLPDDLPAGMPVEVRVFDEEAAARIEPEEARWAGLRAAAPVLDDRDAGLFTEALALANWHEAAPFCPRCGSTTTVVQALPRRGLRGGFRCRRLPVQSARHPARRHLGDRARHRHGPPHKPPGGAGHDAGDEGPVLGARCAAGAWCAAGEALRRGGTCFSAPRRATCRVRWSLSRPPPGGFSGSRRRTRPLGRLSGIVTRNSSRQRTSHVGWADAADLLRPSPVPACGHPARSLVVHALYAELPRC